MSNGKPNIYPDQRSMEESLEQAKIVERLGNLMKTNKTEHEAILKQTTATNGKVAEIIKWKERMTGGIVVLNIIVVPVLLFLLYERLTKGG
jgi:hypothetical protein